MNPSPQVDLKFKTNAEDPVHGNDFVDCHFGLDAEQRHRNFKAFFACQDPARPIPDRKLSPNWKVKPLLTWMNFIFPIMFFLRVAFSIDETKMRFKGKHADKLRVTYKKEGDGFQCDALCQEGYTY